MKVLLHICCGVCAAPVIERLLCDGHTVTGFFYNPNIHPEDEYQRRLEAAKKTAEALGIDLIEGAYDRQNWFEAVKGEQTTGEGGERCCICYEMRLRKAREVMRKKDMDAFTTTLTVSPHKSADTINRIGRSIDEDRFLCYDFKKKGGFQRSSEFAKEHGLYRQHYCGCIYSLEESLKREKERTSADKGKNHSDEHEEKGS